MVFGNRCYVSAELALDVLSKTTHFYPRCALGRTPRRTCTISVDVHVEGAMPLFVSVAGVLWLHSFHARHLSRFLAFNYVFFCV